jgi:hypothetical protein
MAPVPTETILHSAKGMPQIRRVVDEQVHPLPKSQSNNRVIHEYQSTNRRFTLINIIATQGGTCSHTASGTASRRKQRKLGLLAPSLSAGRTPYSSQLSSSSNSGSEPAKNLSVHLVLATHHPPYDAFALWNWMQLGLRRET